MIGCFELEELPVEVGNFSALRSLDLEAEVLKGCLAVFSDWSLCSGST